METNTGESRLDTIPRYEVRPAIPSTSLPSHAPEGDFKAMDAGTTNAQSGRASRDTSVLSMDDIEAAQALEGLRTGTYR